jgi:hypothetical protein
MLMRIDPHIFSILEARAENLNGPIGAAMREVSD